MTKPYLGEFVYRYASNTAYRVTVLDDVTLHWECIEGEAKGVKGSELVQRQQVTNNVFFLTWIGDEGYPVFVTQVVDFEGMKVFATVIENNERYILEGSIVRV